jgi:mitochondrial fission protein ELM1
MGPPWPDLVIGASRRSAPVARWIQRRSGGRARLVHLLHVQAPLRHFDLVATLPQYRLPERPNVLHLTGALNRPPPERLAAAASDWTKRFEELPRPWIALLVGGDSSSYDFAPQEAARLGREASREAHACGGSLLVSTSPRTSAAATRALEDAIDVPAHFYRWRPDDDDNPYLAYLALADRFVVTVDSASLPMEACGTGKPVQVFEWPRRAARARGLRGWLAPRPDGAPLRGLAARVVELGLLKPPRDFDAYHRALRQRGLTTRLGDAAAPPARREPDDVERLVARVRGLFGEERGAGR